MSIRLEAPRPVVGPQRGFTLVELLVVIGIIALLLAILMPALWRAKESARRIECLNDLRQLGTALMFYTQENRGRFPGAWDWHPRLNGTTWEGPLLRYHGVSNAQVPKLYTCPSDDPETRRPGRYPFTYTGNWHVFWFDPTRSVVKITEIRRSSEKIMIIDESPETVDDNVWAPENWFGDRQNMLSNRHDLRRERAREGNPEDTLKRGKGCVVFADGRADFVDRRLAMDANYCDARKP